MKENWLALGAVVKGLLEHNDSSRFFGSTGSLSYYHHRSTEEGLITRVDQEGVTEKGREWYNQETEGLAAEIANCLASSERAEELK